MNLADFAQHSYTDVAPRGYAIDSELSGPDRKVYHKEGKAIVAFRGTNLKNSRDHTANAGMGAGIKHKLNRFKNSLDVTERAMKKYGRDHVTITGHSLGGAQALYVHHKTGLKGAAYNPWIGPTDYIQAGGNLKSQIKDNFNVHAVVGDIVSAGAVPLGLSSNVHLYTPKSAYAATAHALTGQSTQDDNPHGLHSIGQFSSGGKYADKVTARDSRVHDLSASSTSTSKGIGSALDTAKQDLKLLPQAFKDTGSFYEKGAQMTKGIPIIGDYLTGLSKTTTGIGDIASGKFKKGGLELVQGAFGMALPLKTLAGV